MESRRDCGEGVEKGCGGRVRLGTSLNQNTEAKSGLTAAGQAGVWRGKDLERAQTLALLWEKFDFT